MLLLLCLGFTCPRQIPFEECFLSDLLITGFWGNAVQEEITKSYIISHISMLLCMFYWKLQYLPNMPKSNFFLFMCQYPQDKTKDIKMPVELRVNIWLGLSAVEKKFNSFAEGTFSVFAEMVRPPLLSHFTLECKCCEFNEIGDFWIFFFFFACWTERESSIYSTETSRPHSMIKSIVPTRWTSAH